MGGSRTSTHRREAMTCVARARVSAVVGPARPRLGVPVAPDRASLLDRVVLAAARQDHVGRGLAVNMAVGGDALGNRVAGVAGHDAPGPTGQSRSDVSLVRTDARVARRYRTVEGLGRRRVGTTMATIAGGHRYLYSAIDVRRGGVTIGATPELNQPREALVRRGWSAMTSVAAQWRRVVPAR